MSTLEILNEIFRDVFDDESLVITESTSAEDISDWDSLTHIRLTAAIEKSFGVRFAMNEIPELKQVRNILAKIEA